MNQTDIEREVYEARLKGVRDRDAQLRDALEIGDYIGRIRFSQELLGLPVTPREELQDSTLDQLAALASELQQKVKSRPG